MNQSHGKASLKVLLALSLLSPSLSFSRGERGRNRLTDHHIVESAADSTSAQVFLGAIDLVGAVAPLNSVYQKIFTNPNTLRLGHQMAETAKILAENEKKLFEIKNSSTLELKEKKQRVANIEKKMARLKQVQATQEQAFAKLSKSGGLGIQALKIAARTFFIVDLSGRIIVWNLLNDFPGYVTDFGDLKNIAVNIFGMGDWEFGKDDGSRDREL